MSLSPVTLLTSLWAVTVALTNTLSPMAHMHAACADITVSFNASSIEVHEDDGEVRLLLESSVAVDKPYTVTLRADMSPPDPNVTHALCKLALKYMIPQLFCAWDCVANGCQYCI